MLIVRVNNDSTVQQKVGLCFYPQMHETCTSKVIDNYFLKQKQFNLKHGIIYAKQLSVENKDSWADVSQIFIGYTH